jgi:hypothetical protein
VMNAPKRASEVDLADAAINEDERRRLDAKHATEQRMARREVLKRGGHIASSPDLHARLEHRLSAIQRDIGNRGNAKNVVAQRLKGGDD